MKPEHRNEQNDLTHYDFSSPLWEKYFWNIRKNVKFPRNYKEISASDETQCSAF